MIKVFLFLFLCSFVISCGTTDKNIVKYNILMISYPDQSNPDDCPSYESEIIGFDIRTNEYRQFTVDNFEDAAPSYSPSGDKIFFCSKRPNTGYLTGPAPKRLFIGDIQSHSIEQIQIENEDEDKFIPDFSTPICSPVSNEIAFGMKNLNNGKVIIYDLNSDEVKLKMDVLPYINKIRWSSNGKYLAYLAYKFVEAGNSINPTFELGFIDIKNKSQKILERTESLSWNLISGVPGNDNFLIYNIDSAYAPIKIYEYNVETNDRKYLATTIERWPEECGATENEILFIKTAEDNTQDIWLLNIKNNTFTQITSDGKTKSDISYFRD